MKQKLIILFALLLILAAGAFMIWDFYYDGDKDSGNPYEYDLSEYKKVSEELLCYKEVNALDLDMEKVKGIAIDEKDRAYVVGNDKVIIFNKEGGLVQEFAVDNEVNCVAVHPNGDIYLGVSDHIEVRDFSGNRLANWPAPQDGALFTSIAVSENDVYGADAGNRVVYQFDLQGNLIKSIGKKNKERGEPGFIIPSPYFDLLLGREGELWVVNPGMHTLQSYNQEGELVSTWKRTSMQLDGFSGCCNPSHIAMLSNGSFVTSEKGIERVKVHLPSGDFACVVASPESFESGTTGLDLAVDSRNRIYVLDPKKKKLRIFEENSL